MSAPSGLLGWLRVVVAGAAVLAGTVVFSSAFAVVGASRPVVAVGGVLALGAVAALLLAVPVRYLPAIALVVFAVFPAQLQPDQGVANVLRPSLLVLYAWVVRRWWSVSANPARDSGPHPAQRAFLAHLLVHVAAVLLGAWLLVSIQWSVIPTTSTSWTTVFLVSCFVPLLVPDARAEAASLRTALLWTGAALGAYTVVEQVLRSSPVFDALYAAVGAGAREPWAVYRSEASFGHPLWAGAFFVVPAALGLVSWLQTGRTRDGLLGLAAAVGVLMTVSRGSLLALGAGLVVGFVLVCLTAWRPAARRLLSVVPLGLVAFAGLSVFRPLTERAGSQESGLSAGVRERAVDVALSAAGASGYLGSGPATSGVSGRRISDIVIENSLLQLLISVGIPGLLLFLLLMGCAWLAAVSRRDLATAAAVVAYLAAITGFNSLDGVRAMHVVIGFLLVLALHGVPTPPARAAAPSVAPAHRRTAGDDVAPRQRLAPAGASR